MVQEALVRGFSKILFSEPDLVSNVMRRPLKRWRLISNFTQTSSGLGTGVSFQLHFRRSPYRGLFLMSDSVRSYAVISEDSRGIGPKIADFIVS